MIDFTNSCGKVLDVASSINHPIKHLIKLGLKNCTNSAYFSSKVRSVFMPETRMQRRQRLAKGSVLRRWRSPGKIRGLFAAAVTIALVVQLSMPILSFDAGASQTTALAASQIHVGAWYPYYFGNYSNWNAKFTKLQSKGVTDFYIDAGSLAAARFPSKLISHDYTYVDAVVPAAKAHGIQIHLWRQNYYVDPGTESYNTLKAKDCLLRDANGSQNPNYLDPANDYVSNLDKQVTLEMLDRYAGKVDGYNFDYIRYPKADTGYTAAARKKFEAAYGAVAKWPGDVRPGGSRYSQFKQFKINLVTNHVKDMYTAIKAKYPNIIVSADVWPSIDTCRNNIMQDWPSWKNFMDVFINMTYADPKANSWYQRVTEQNIQLGAPKPVYTGVGVIGQPGAVYNPTDNMLNQAKYAVNKGVQGIVIWNDNGRFEDDFAHQFASYLGSALYSGQPSVEQPPVQQLPARSISGDGVPAGSLAQGKPAVASSVERAGYEADKAVDGNKTTAWSSQYSDPQWLYVDLGSSLSIGKVVLDWETAYAKAYEIQVSNDATTWTTKYSTANGAGGTETINLPAGTKGRYIRVYSTQRATKWGNCLWEFGVYPSDTSITVPAPGTGTTQPGDGTSTPPSGGVTTPGTIDTSTPPVVTPPVDTNPPAAPDTQAPVTTIDDPMVGTITGTQKLIKGTTMDDVAVKKVELAIQRNDGDYWTGNGWSPTEVWLPADITSGADTKIATWTYLWQLVWSDNLPYKIKARGIDTSGNIEGTAMVVVQVDNVAPSGKITIDGDSKFTNKKAITVTNSINGASKMRFKVDGSTWTPWEDFAGTKGLELTNTPGVKTVTGQFSDGANAYETSATITYLNLPGTGPFALKDLVTYPAGWNMISVPNGADLNTPLYTYDTTNKVYTQADTPVAGTAYWAHFDKPVTVPVLLKSIDTFNVLLQSGWNMVGNPFDTAVKLPSGYTAYSYNPSTGDYQTTTSIPEGGGVFIKSPDTRTLTLSK